MDKNSIINKLDALSKKKIEKYCGADSIVKIQSLRSKLETSDRIKIVNTGLVSSGKSTLFNILIDRIEDERFKTGAARETVKSDSECIEEGVYLIDTPGINVREEDDELAYKSILESDIIVLIHNIKTGMPNRQEIEWLEKICAGINNREEIKNRVMFVCSWIDERDREEDYQHTIKTTKDMVFEASGTEIDFFEVSAKRYKNGCLKNNDKLIELSNINEFKKILLEKAHSYKNKGMNESETEQSALNLCSDCWKSLKDAKGHKETEINKIRNKHTEEYNRKKNIWKNIFSELKIRYDRIVELKRERNNI